MFKDYSSEKRTSTSRYELNIFDFDTNPKYLPSWSTTGRFHRVVESARGRSHELVDGEAMVQFLAEHDITDVIQ